MLKKIKEYIKNKNYEDRSLLIGITKYLILTSIVLIVLSIFIKLLLMFKGFLGSGCDIIYLISIFLLLISLISGFFLLSTLKEKIDKYCLSFHTDEEIIENIRRYYYSNMDEKTGFIYEFFRNLYKKREDKILENLKEITPNLSDNWLFNLSGTVDVRKLLLSKDIIWYSQQVSKKSFIIIVVKL